MVRAISLFNKISLAQNLIFEKNFFNGVHHTLAEVLKSTVPKVINEITHFLSLMGACVVTKNQPYRFITSAVIVEESSKKNV